LCKKNFQNNIAFMKTSFQKQSLGGGYGINRNTGGDRSLSTAVPPYGNTRIKPGGGFSRSAVGLSGKKHFQGAKVISGKK
jgi:hypothetical protein